MTAEVTSDGSSAPTRLTRRRVLGMSVAAAVMAPALAAPAEAAALSAPSRRPSSSSRAQALHLVRRATYGPTPGLIAEVTSRGPNAWLERQLHPHLIPDPAGAAITALYPEAGWTVRQVYRAIETGRIKRYSWDVMLPLGQYSLAMATWSSRQLQELMVEFWSNHLNVTNTSDGVWDNRQDYDRRVIRAHALGKFSDMLAASAAHPAMLEYLNQGDSTKTAPNENYGRELLELHTVGVDAGYTEAMVLDSARIMTGYTIDWEESSPRYREYRYDPSIHWTGRVRVMDGRSSARTSATWRVTRPRHAPSLASSQCGSCRTRPRTHW
jgi:hypothetical protein